MDRKRVESILSIFPDKTILVVGDIMLDEFIWGKVRRISPEAPVPIVEVTDETYRLGGAGNVAANIRGLDGRANPDRRRRTRRRCRIALPIYSKRLELKPTGSCAPTGPQP